MDIDKILVNMSTTVDKSKTYLKGLFNKGVAELTEQFGDALTEDRMGALTLGKIGKQYGMSKTSVDALINGEDAIEEDFDLDFQDEEDVFSEPDDVVSDDSDGITIYDNVDDIPSPTGWASIMADIPDPLAKAKENAKYEATPSLIIELGPTYYLKVDMTEDPRTLEFEGKYGAYESTAMKIFLKKISDSDLYSLKYDKGDYAGKLRYVNGQKYTLWMDEKCMGFFKLFWLKHRGVPVPDERIFTFRKSKDGKYNVFKFGLPK